MGTETKKGYIIKLIRVHNYGFIKFEERDVFFHRAGVIEPDFEALKEGMEVEFLEVDDKDGKTRAIGVVVV